MSETKSNVSNVLRHQQLKDSMQNLVVDVIAQREELDEAQKMLLESVSSSRHQRDILNLEEHINILSEELTRIRERTELVGCTDSLAVIVENLRKAMAKTKSELESRPTYEELLRVGEDVSVQLRRTKEEFRLDFAAKLDLERLRIEQEETSKLIRDLSSSLERKVDKIDLARLELISTRIEKWGDSSEQIQTHLEELQQKSEVDHHKLCANEKAIARLEQHVASLMEQSQTNARVEDIQDVASRVAHLEKSKGSKQALDNVECQSKETGDLVQTVMEHISKLMVNVDSVSRATAEILSQKEVEKKRYLAHEKTTLHEIERLKAGLQRHATKDDMDKVETQLSELSSRSSLLEKSSDIAIRFIDWFGRRGSAYEQNAGVLERQLRDLVKGSLQQFPTTTE